MLVGVITMVLADIATATVGAKNRTTMRDMPPPEYFSISFYSVSQIIATAYLMLGAARGNLTEYAFCILFPIQIAAFSMTM
jgi:hypothetical protein